MSRRVPVLVTSALGLLCLGALRAPKALGQDPIVTPTIVDTTAPIVVKAVKPKPKQAGLAKFEGYVMNANRAQVTVRAKDNNMSIQTFSLSQPASAKMQTIIDKGGYQYGDKIKVYYNPQSMKAIKFKGKPSRPL